MGTNLLEHDAYSSLKHIILQIINYDNNNSSSSDFNGTFSLCFWLYLPPNSSPFPSTLLHQHHPDMPNATPFLSINESKEMILYPIRFLHQEASSPIDSTPGIEIPSARTKVEVPLSKWVHVGCEVSTNVMRLYIDGEIVREMNITCTLDKESQDGLKKVLLAGANGDGSVDGYVHGVEILPVTTSIKDCFLKDPPVQLCVDSSSATDIEEESDGVWSIVGGKSCHRNFSLDVLLTTALDHSVNKEMEVVAMLTYADNGAPVEKSDDVEFPLLTCCDGMEYSSRPSKLINGRASFKLKISLVSSKCDNRLFRIKFDIPKMGRKYPFLEAFSRPIRCVSQNNNNSPRPSTLIWKRSTSSMHVLNGISAMDGGPVEPLQNIVHEAKPSPSSKRIKLGQGDTFASLKVDNPSKQGDNEGKLNNGRTSEDRQEMDRSSSDSDSSEATNSCKSTPSNRSPVSDLTVFKYCLGTLAEKSLLLKDIASSTSEQELAGFALQVSEFLGCLHHRKQIRSSKRLIDEGTKVWNLVSQNNYHVLWDNMILVLREQFTNVAGCKIRFLAPQDFEVLRRIGGCQELVAQENFEKLWCWLYPVAFALSQDGLNELWDSRWIEGLITKEEAESSLQGPGGLQEPGTFVLRFPTSRSWPHPDAGNLVVTYIGSDFAIHHRLLALDSIHGPGAAEMPTKSLKDMLLEEHELSRLGRITRRSLLV